MAEFSIRSIEFKNINKLPTGVANQASLVGVDTESKSFIKIAPNDLISQKIAEGEGIDIDYDVADRKYHIGKDYTDTELVHLNTIDIYLNSIVANCTDNNCTQGCATVVASATSVDNANVSG